MKLKVTTPWTEKADNILTWYPQLKSIKYEIIDDNLYIDVRFTLALLNLLERIRDDGLRHISGSEVGLLFYRDEIIIYDDYIE